MPVCKTATLTFLSALHSCPPHISIPARAVAVDPRKMLSFSKAATSISNSISETASFCNFVKHTLVLESSTRYGPLRLRRASGSAIFTRAKHAELEFKNTVRAFHQGMEKASKGRKMEDSSSSQKKSGASSSSAAVDVALPVVAGYLRESEAKARLAPVSKAAQEATARSETITVDTNEPGFVEDIMVHSEQDYPSDDEDSDEYWDLETFPGTGAEMVFVPSSTPWQPFENAGKAIKTGVDDSAGRVIVLIPLTEEQCLAAGVSKDQMKSAKSKDIVALPGLKPLECEAKMRLLWKLDEAIVHSEVTQGVLKVGVLAEADLNDVGSWNYKGRANFPLGDIWAKYQTQDIREGVSWADKLIPDELVKTLNRQVDELASKRTKDYHPHSKDVVLDHVHPALYSYIRDVSPFTPSSDLESPPKFKDGDGKIVTDRWGRPFEASKYQWMPTYFDISKDKSVSIRNDINGLRPASDYPELYDTISRLFRVMIPRIEAIIAYGKWVRVANSGGEDDEDDEPEETDWEVDEGRPLEKINLAGKSLQVITKIVDYELQPGESYEGVWHVEGMSHERIVGTCVNVIERGEGIVGGELMYRRGFTTEERGRLLYGVAQCRNPAFDKIMEDALAPLGMVATPEGRTIVFPNSHVHKVRKMTNTSDKPARRRIAVFFIVDPEHRIVSTQEVPDQSSVLSLDEAKAHRLELMKERKMHKQDWNIRAVELCEH